MKNEESTKIISLLESLEMQKYKDRHEHPLENNLEFIALKEMARHYFKPQIENSDFCNVCGLYFTDEVHRRDIEEVIK